LFGLDLVWNGYSLMCESGLGKVTEVWLQVLRNLVVGKTEFLFKKRLIFLREKRGVLEETIQTG